MPEPVFFLFINIWPYWSTTSPNRLTKKYNCMVGSIMYATQQISFDKLVKPNTFEYNSTFSDILQNILKIES